MYEGIFTIRYGTSNSLLRIISFVSTHALLAFLQNSRVRWHAEIWDRLKELGATQPEFIDFSKHNVVYTKICHRRRYFYIGMSSLCCIEREISRLRKYKQKSFAYREPCLSYWESTDSFFEFVCFPLMMCNCELEAYVQETDLIMTWKAPLNVPFVTKLKKEKQGAVKNQSKRKVRMLKRYRRRTRTGYIIKQRSRLFTKATSILHCLHWIAEPERPSFSVQQVLRHHAISNRELYKLLKLCKILEEPKLSKSRSEVKLALKHREVLVPGAARPLEVMPLAAPDFKASAVELLKQITSSAATHCLPFHLPPASVLEKAWPSIGKKVLNFRKPPSASCPCEQHRDRLPKTAFSGNGHLVAEGQNLKSLLKLDSDLAFRSHKEAQWPCKEVFAESTQKAFNEYFQRNAVFPDFRRSCSTAINQWIEVQWNKHISCIHRHASDDLAKVISATKWLVMTTEDHAATKLVAICPWWHEELTLKTFQDPNIWRTEAVEPTQLADILIGMIPKGQPNF